jgi:hypothetical protein
MASLETLKGQTLARMTRAIENILNPGDEKHAQIGKPDPPPEGKKPNVDLQREFAICALWDARKELNIIDAKLVSAQGSISENQQYNAALKAIKKELGDENSGGSKHVADARREAKTVEIAHRLRAAQRSIGDAKYYIRLMESSFWRALASNWIIVAAILFAIVIGLLYYVLYGAGSLEPVPKSGSTSLGEKTTLNVKYLGQLITDSTETTEKVTKLMKAFKDLFSEIPLVIAAIGVVLKLITGMIIKKS